MEKSKDKKYCFDSSAFINSWRIHYRPSTFNKLWEKLGGFIEQGSILIPDEVKKEIKAGNDELTVWFKNFDSYAIAPTTEQIEIVTDIVNKYPLVSQYRKPRPFHADPFVVALGKLTETTVVTYERKNGSSENPSIPDLCEEYKVKCCTISDFFEKQGWQFDLM